MNRESSCFLASVAFVGRLVSAERLSVEGDGGTADLEQLVRGLVAIARQVASSRLA